MAYFGGAFENSEFFIEETGNCRLNFAALSRLLAAAWGAMMATGLNKAATLHCRTEEIRRLEQLADQVALVQTLHYDDNGALRFVIQARDQRAAVPALFGPCERTVVVQIRQFTQLHDHEKYDSTGQPDLALNSDIEAFPTARSCGCRAAQTV